MNRTAILGPVFALMLLTLAVWTYMYARRIPFIIANRLSPEQLRPIELARISPPPVSNPSDNLKNLFELPTIFYAAALYLYVADRVDMAYLSAAWIFVGFRLLHSLVHCTVNIVILRFWLYCVGALALWFMVVRSAVGALG